jgi:ribosome maturation factor RimP
LKVSFVNIKEKEDILREKITPFIDREGLSVFEVRVFFAEGRVVLRVLVDYPQGGISLDECVRLNRKLSDYLDKEPLFDESFLLEVSSPGAKRELATLKDFLRIKNQEVSIWLKTELEGKTQYDGRVLDVDLDKEAVFLGLADKEIRLPLDTIRKAKQKIK